MSCCPVLPNSLVDLPDTGDGEEQEEEEEEEEEEETEDEFDFNDVSESDGE